MVCSFPHPSCFYPLTCFRIATPRGLSDGGCLVLPLPDAPGGHRLGVNSLTVDEDNSIL
jgi:hypothetical protein